MSHVATVGVRVVSAGDARADARLLHQYFDAVAARVASAPSLTDDDRVAFTAQHRAWIDWYNENVINRTVLDGDWCEQWLAWWRGYADQWNDRAKSSPNPQPKRPPLTTDPGPGSKLPGVKLPDVPPLFDLSQLATPLVLLAAVWLLSRRN